MWIGPPGLLEKLPDPARGYSPSRELRAAPFTSASGYQSVDRSGWARRMWGLGWFWLTDGQYSTLETYANTRYGGPLVFIDPARTNLLSDNQSSGTDTRSDMTGFAASAGTLASTTEYSKAGPRSLRWTLPGSPASPSVDATWRWSVHGHPVVPDTDYLFAAWLSASVAGNSVSARLQWRDAAGSLISTTAWSPVALTGFPGTFEQVSVSATAPYNAAYVLPQLVADTGVGSAVIRIDQLQLAMASAPLAWTLGADIPWVAVESLAATVPVYGRFDNVQMTLRELG